jgi:hypothetical protein
LSGMEVVPRSVDRDLDLVLSLPGYRKARHAAPSSFQSLGMTEVGVWFARGELHRAARGPRVLASRAAASVDVARGRSLI